METKSYPWNGDTLRDKYGSPVEVFGWRDSVTVDHEDEHWSFSMSLTIEGARALAAQLIAAADHAEGKA